MLKIGSREYKLMFDPRPFAAGESAAALWGDVAEAARGVGAGAEGAFDAVKEREVLFLDTPDRTLDARGLLLRRRSRRGGGAAYTLKCRGEDRYVAAGADVRAGRGLKGTEKFEEDVAAPFRGRFSKSNTVSRPADAPTPERLDAAAALFPALGRLRLDGRPCDPRTPLEVVRGLRAAERVLTGPRLCFGKTPASVALTLWSIGPSARPRLAELSFRYGDDRERYDLVTAATGRELFAALQRLDGCLPEGTTKTAFAFGRPGAG